MKLVKRLLVLALLPALLFAQTSNLQPYDTLAVTIFKKTLADNWAYETLYDLTTNIGHRLSGSSQAASAVEWSKNVMEHIGADRVWLEPVMVPHWVRGDIEEGTILANGSRGAITLNITALGGSIATPTQGITAEVIEVKSFDELGALGDKAKGKIVFYNRPMDRTQFDTFNAYGGAVNQRGRGAIEAARAGGVAALVRSMATRLDYFPHTGGMGYVDSVTKVPAAAISTRDAETLSELLKTEKSVRVRFKLSAQTLPDVESHNVIGEIRGSEKPEEVVLVGGHLDSWDKGQGAHDDGAGCVQSIEVLRLIKELGLKPKRTIRAVMFMNEENGLRGGIAYAQKERPGERHIAAIESDAGGFNPRGFGVGDSLAYSKLVKWAPLFAPIGADKIELGGGGADIGPLARQRGVPPIGLNVNSHRYFDHHHSDNDTIEWVNERELALGAAAMAVLAYVIAQEGL
ncbi:MAG: M20/M25/M40 family metallo-hydrolase [Ignavibacteriae bacterium]|nr:M20/M25/M40 family metallo-hydrolase [Ignavibacteriota bacterium]